MQEIKVEYVSIDKIKRKSAVVFHISYKYNVFSQRSLHNMAFALHQMLTACTWI